MTYKDIARIIPAIQSVKLVEHNLKSVKKKQSVKSMTKLGVENIVGTSLIKMTSDIIE